MVLLPDSCKYCVSLCEISWIGWDGGFSVFFVSVCNMHINSSIIKNKNNPKTEKNKTKKPQMDKYSLLRVNVCLVPDSTKRNSLVWAKGRKYQTASSVYIWTTESYIPELQLLRWQTGLLFSLKQLSGTKVLACFIFMELMVLVQSSPKINLWGLMPVGKAGQQQIPREAQGYHKPDGRIMSHCQLQQSLTSDWTLFAKLQRTKPSSYIKTRPSQPSRSHLNKPIACSQENFLIVYK